MSRFEFLIEAGFLHSPYLLGFHLLIIPGGGLNSALSSLRRIQ